MSTTVQWPPADLGKGPNPYPFHSWQWHEHQCAARYARERFLAPFKVAAIVLFLLGAVAGGIWGFTS